jgi:hypothetical protein
MLFLHEAHDEPDKRRHPKATGKIYGSKPLRKLFCRDFRKGFPQLHDCLGRIHPIHVKRGLAEFSLGATLDISRRDLDPEFLLEMKNQIEEIEGIGSQILDHPVTFPNR